MPKNKGLLFKQAKQQMGIVKMQIQAELAQEAVKFAQADAPEDTGFYKSHIYAIAPGERGRRTYSQKLFSPAEGRMVTRTSGTVGLNNADSAAIVASAVYSIHIERRQQVIANAVWQTAAIAAQVVDRHKV